MFLKRQNIVWEICFPQTAAKKIFGGVRRWKAEKSEPSNWMEEQSSKSGEAGCLPPYTLHARRGDWKKLEPRMLGTPAKSLASKPRPRNAACLRCVLAAPHLPWLFKKKIGVSPQLTPPVIVIAEKLPLARVLSSLFVNVFDWNCARIRIFFPLFFCVEIQVDYV